jgi:diaminohydroxyphosphoribosylaminopyrimidine deaminase / 5-amino-6-(5-phosphoribosylamino)uracil reductase
VVDASPATLSASEVSALDVAFGVAASPEVPHGPNPRVGAVVLDRDGVVAGVGHHRGAGTAHAEVVALAEAGERARGGTVVVTLEPCHHTGRTGPCTHALLAAGVARVIHALSDPNAVAAGGSAYLRSCGIEVSGDVARERAIDLNRPWFEAMRRNRPWVTAKLAMTLDGRIAAADGTSRWITSSAARSDVHVLRSQVQAIVVGTGTVLADNPRLTVRDLPDQILWSGIPPLRVVVGHRSLPTDAHAMDDQAPSLHLRTHDPRQVLADLWDRGIVHVMLESGPTVATSWIRDGLVDELVTYMAPALLGSGPSAFGDLAVGTIEEALRFTFTEVTVVGPDVRLRTRFGATEPHERG